MAPVDEARAQRIFDEQAVEAAAIDEQRCFQDFARIEADGAQVFGFTFAQHFIDAGVDAPHAARFRERAQEGREPPGVEMHRPVEVLEFDARLLRRHGYPVRT
jgi:hypothetical protein